MPISLDWDASDSPIKGAKPCKAFMLRTWDAQNQQTTHIDIWEQDFNVDEMNHFMFQTIATLSDTYQRATSNNDLANEMREFAYKFAQKNGIKFNR